MKKIFTPGTIGKMMVPNRIVMQAMYMSWCRDGYVDDRIIEFYRERARGGMGMMMVGGCPIDEAGSYGPTMISISDDRYLPGLGKIAQAVKREGVRAALQLFHAGRYASSRTTGKQPVAPSPLPSRLSKEEPHQLTIEEIQKIISDFAAGARRAVSAGFEAVEVLAGTGYLISQFLSPVTNKRDDEYGGSFENRMRIGLEAASAIKKEIGNNIPLLFRVSVHDMMDGGNSHRDIAVFCQKLVDRGVDAINLTTGWHESKVPQVTMEVPPGSFGYFAKFIKENVSVPVISSVRVNHPAVAETILQNGCADFVGMARPFIAEPHIVKKAAEGRAHLIRPCIACNQGCLDNIFIGQESTCLANPRVGREQEFPMDPAEQKKNVLVVGGGPAGLEAACRAAQRGHRVTVWERSGRIGGQLNLAGVPHGRREFKTLVRFYEAQITELGVRVELNKEATEEEILNFSPDALVIATGGMPIVPGLPGVDLPVVVQAWNVLDQKASVGEQIIVVGGGAVGCETALYLAKLGAMPAEIANYWGSYLQEDWPQVMSWAARGSKQITVLEMRKQIGIDIGITTRWGIIQELQRSGVKLMTEAEVISIQKNGVEIKQGEEVKFLPADTVVLAVGTRPQSELASSLQGKVPELYVVGDAAKPRKALDGIREGFEAGCRI
jgi:2,4-dienoyl-CoA reductase (NADPH2)